MIGLPQAKKFVNTKVKAGVDITRLGLKTRGEEMTFFSDDLTQIDINKLKIALTSHKAEPVKATKLFTEEQLEQIRQIIQEENK